LGIPFPFAPNWQYLTEESVDIIDVSSEIADVFETPTSSDDHSRLTSPSFAHGESSDSNAAENSAVALKRQADDGDGQPSKKQKTEHVPRSSLHLIRDRKVITELTVSILGNKLSKFDVISVSSLEIMVHIDVPNLLL